MDETSDDDFESFRKLRLREFESTLGLRAGFIEDLIQQDDDWSFVIKAHAIVEAAITQLVAHLIGHPEALEKLLSTLSMGGRHGKVAFVRCLMGLSDPELDFAEALGTIRNHAAHRVSNVEGFSLTGYLKSLERGEFERMRGALDTVFYTPNPDEIVVETREGPDEPPLSAREVFLRVPERLIVHTLLNVLFSIDLRTEGAKQNLKARREFEAVNRDALIRLLANARRGDSPT
jgi:hypothetical protein